MTLSTSQYQPLLPDQIRCLRLSPGSDEEPLVGELETIVLNEDDKGQTPFEALSYVWGSNAMTHTLELSGHSISITSSLHSALSRLRLASERRTLWADALCINQEDIAEKERQIPLMGRIFGSATHVIVDLGEASDQSDAAIDLMDRHWRTAICTGASALRYGKALSPVETAWLLSMPPDAVDMAWQNHELPEVDSAEWDQVWDFLRRPWFSRAWVVQEFVLARDVLCLCGRRAFDWRSIMALFIDYEHGRAFVNVVYMRWWARPLDLDLYTRHDIVRCMFFHRGVRLLQATPLGHNFLSKMPPETTPWWRNSFLDLLYAYRHAGCTIARDRYFAILGLALEHHLALAPELKPDYTSPDEEWEQRIGKFVLQLPGGAEAFMHSGLKAHADVTAPSWSQHFSMTGDSALSDQCKNDQLSTAAGSNSVFSVTPVPGSHDVVELKGHRVDRVLELMRAPPLGAEPSDQPESTADTVRLQLLRSCGASINYYTAHILSKATPGSRPVLDWSSLETYVMATSLNTPMTSSSDYNSEVTAKAVLGFYLTLVDSDEVADSLWYWKEPLAEKLKADYGYENALPVPTRTTENREGDVSDAIISAQESFEEPMSPQEDDEVQDSSNRFSYEDFVYLSQKLALDLGVVARVVDMVPGFSIGGSFLTVPRGTEPDDEIWIISGCRLPVILRRSQERPGMHRLMGTCYAEGIMMGEALKREGFQWDNVQLY